MSPKVTQATDSNTDRSFSQSTDPDMPLSRGLGLEDTMAPDGSTGLSDVNSPGSILGLRLQQGHRLWPRLQTYICALLPMCATEFNTDPDCGRTMGSDMVLGNSYTRMSPWPQVAANTIQIALIPVVGQP